MLNYVCLFYFCKCVCAKLPQLFKRTVACWQELANKDEQLNQNQMIHSERLEALEKVRTPLYVCCPLAVAHTASDPHGATHWQDLVRRDQELSALQIAHVALQEAFKEQQSDEARESLLMRARDQVQLELSNAEEQLKREQENATKRESMQQEENQQIKDALQYELENVAAKEEEIAHLHARFLQLVQVVCCLRFCAFAYA